MQTRLPPETLATAVGREADEILRRCVHCGFCNATCPTYALTGNELEGPRGRIYLVKGLLEGEAAGEATLAHLDHCLGCRACETTCPSGVKYHRLADIGREVLHERRVRPRGALWLRRLLARFFDGSLALRAGVALGRLFRPLLPGRLARQLPPATVGYEPPAANTRQTLLLEGCVQPVLTPGTNAAAARILARRGVAVRPAAGCCGALAYHLGDLERARRQVRRNVDAWLPALEGGEGLTVTASGCAAFIRDYPAVCRGDERYEDRAAELAAAVRDVADFLEPTPSTGASPAVALHLPCTLRHALGGSDRLRRLLRDSGWTLAETSDDGQCCGSAGAYSLLFQDTAGALRRRKIDQLTAAGAAEIVTANIGCRLHLAAATPVPVRHWIEVWDEREAAGATAASDESGATTGGTPPR